MTPTSEFWPGVYLTLKINDMGTNWVDEQEIMGLEKQVEELTKQRNELLEAMKNIVSMNGVGYKKDQQALFIEHLQPLIKDAQAAIKNCEK